MGQIYTCFDKISWLWRTPSSSVYGLVDARSQGTLVLEGRSWSRDARALETFVL